MSACQRMAHKNEMRTKGKPLGFVALPGSGHTGLMKLVHSQELPEKRERKPWKVTGYVFAWTFSLAFFAALALLVLR
jgi:hypothetical protein